MLGGGAGQSTIRRGEVVAKERAFERREQHRCPRPELLGITCARRRRYRHRPTRSEPGGQGQLCRRLAVQVLRRRLHRHHVGGLHGDRVGHRRLRRHSLLRQLHQHLGHLQLIQPPRGDAPDRSLGLRTHPTALQHALPPHEHRGCSLQPLLRASHRFRPCRLVSIPPTKLPDVPRQPHRQAEPVQRPPLRPGERPLHELPHLPRHVRRHLLPAFKRDFFPRRKQLVERHRDGFVELEALPLALHIEASRVALRILSGPVLPEGERGPRVSVPLRWDTVGAVGDNLGSLREAEQRPLPPGLHVGRQRLQLRGLPGLARPPRRVDHLVPIGVPPFAVREAHDEAALDEPPNTAVDRGLGQAAAVGEHPHGEGHPHTAIPLVRAEHGPEELIEDGALHRRQTDARQRAQHRSRDACVVDAPPGLSRSHGSPAAEGRSPPPGCSPRVADVPRTPGNTPGHRQSRGSDGDGKVHVLRGRPPRQPWFWLTAKTSSTPAASISSIRVPGSGIVWSPGTL